MKSGRSQTGTQDLLPYHERARRHGVNRAVYWVVRAVVQPAMRIWFRLERHGRENVPRSGPVILAANHRSFLDPFVVGVCLRRPVYFVAKQELFEKRWQGWLLNALGAFPIRRGESDEEAVATSKEILARGDAVVIFPEGTRIRTGSLGQPKRGVGRLALETGAPVVPVAVAGTERTRRGWVIRPAKVRARCGRPLTFPRVESASPSLAQRVTERIWPCVELQWEWLGGLPAMRKAAVVGGGEMGTAMAVVLARAGLEVQLACRTFAQAERMGRVPLPASVRVCTVADLEPAGMDLVVLATPLRALTGVVARLGDSIGDRATVLLPVRGELGAHAVPAARHLRERTRAAAVACVGVPDGAAAFVEPGARVDLACGDPDRSRQLREVLAQAGVDVRPAGEPARPPMRRVA
jgi:glycerol-3-phosphate dehydrogenase (NAD(P)+)